MFSAQVSGLRRVQGGARSENVFDCVMHTREDHCVVFHGRVHEVAFALCARANDTVYKRTWIQQIHHKQDMYTAGIKTQLHLNSYFIPVK